MDFLFLVRFLGVGSQKLKEICVFRIKLKQSSPPRNSVGKLWTWPHLWFSGDCDSRRTGWVQRPSHRLIPLSKYLINLIKCCNADCKRLADVWDRVCPEHCYCTCLFVSHGLNLRWTHAITTASVTQLHGMACNASVLHCSRHHVKTEHGLPPENLRAIQFRGMG